MLQSLYLHKIGTNLCNQKLPCTVNIEVFVFNPLMENTYVLYDQSKECVIVDPGCYDPREKTILTDFIREQGLDVKLLLNTHCHIDHVLGNKYVMDTYKVDLAIHKTDVQTLQAVKIYAPNYGFMHFDESEPTVFLEEGDVVSFGETELEVLFVPGHAPGHIAFYHKESATCVSGDVLFRNSIGRTDLPGGDTATLMDSIHKKMFQLPDETTVLSGHGEETTIGYEKKHNPFCRLTTQ